MRKNLFLLSFLLLCTVGMTEANAQYHHSSQMCTVQLVDRGYVVQTFRSMNDMQGLCRDALRDCKREQHMRGIMGAQCVRLGSMPSPNPYPNPSPNPYPNPNPYPTPYPGQGQMIQIGEVVFPLSWSHAKGAEVIAIYPQYSEAKVRSLYSGSVSNVRLDELAVGRGCLMHVCVGQTVFPYSWSHSRGAQVIAISLSQQRILIQSNYSGSVSTVGINEL